MIILSSSLILSKSRAFFNLVVILLSSTDGLVFPLGWLCIKITPVARASIAYLATNLTSMRVEFIAPCDIFA